MLSYLPDDSARQRVHDLIAQAQARDRRQAWNIKKAYRLESQPLKYDRAEVKALGRSLAQELRPDEHLLVLVAVAGDQLERGRQVVQ